MLLLTIAIILLGYLALSTEISKYHSNQGNECPKPKPQSESHFYNFLGLFYLLKQNRVKSTSKTNNNQNKSDNKKSYFHFTLFLFREGENQKNSPHYSYNKHKPKRTRTYNSIGRFYIARHPSKRTNISKYNQYKTNNKLPIHKSSTIYELGKPVFKVFPEISLIFFHLNKLKYLIVAKMLQKKPFLNVANRGGANS